MVAALPACMAMEDASAALELAGEAAGPAPRQAGAEQHAPSSMQDSMPGLSLLGSGCACRNAPCTCGGLAEAAAVERQRQGPRRKERKNMHRASAFCRFLVDTFGQEALRQGTGVLDVAGGRGELAFELLNLGGAPATVVEPRPLELGRRAERLKAAQARGSSTHASSPAQALLPDHLRLLVTPELAACLTQQPAAQGGPACMPPPEWASVLNAAQQAAQRGCFSRPGSAHDSGPGLDAWPAGHLREGAWGLQRHGSGTSVSSASSRGSEAASSGSSSPEPARTPLPNRRRALAWSIPAETESEEEPCCSPVSLISSWPAGMQPQAGGSSLAPGWTAEQPSWHGLQGQQQPAAPMETEQQQPLTASLQQQGPQTPPATAAQPVEVCDPQAAWERFTQCSVVCGLHPDQATEFVVDLGLALNKPFAVVPCCVYAAHLPRRSPGKGGGGAGEQPGGAYDQFLSYLQGKDPEGRIRVATLGFAGRNKVLYRL